MCGWIEQWKAYVPGAFGAANVADPPGGTDTSKPPAESAVTVCWTSSLFSTVIDVPGATVSGPPKAKFRMVIVSAAEAAGAFAAPDGSEGIAAVADAATEDRDDVALFE